MAMTGQAERGGKHGGNERIQKLSEKTFTGSERPERSN